MAYELGGVRGSISEVTDSVTSGDSLLSFFQLYGICADISISHIEPRFPLVNRFLIVERIRNAKRFGTVKRFRIVKRLRFRTVKRFVP